MRAQRLSASNVPDPAGRAPVLAPRILPAVTNTPGPDARTGAATRRNSSKGKTPLNKPAQRKRSRPAQKVGKKHTIKAKGAARKNTKDMPLSETTHSVPCIVPSEQVAVPTEHSEITLIANVPLAPVLVMPEDRPVEPAILAANEPSPHQVQEVRDPAAESDVPVHEETITEPPADSPEKPSLLHAFAIQWAGIWHILMRTWAWTRQKLKSHQVRKRLRVCESVSLGDKRFIAVVQVDGEQFLVGGSSSSVSTLAHLEPRREFSDVLRSRCEQDLSHA